MRTKGRVGVRLRRDGTDPGPGVWDHGADREESAGDSDTDLAGGGILRNCRDQPRIVIDQSRRIKAHGEKPFCIHRWLPYL